MDLLFKFAWEKRLNFILCAVFATIGSLLTIVPYVLIFYIIQNYLTHGNSFDVSSMYQLIAWAFAAVVLRYIVVISAFVFSHLAAFDLLYKIRTRISRHLGTLPLGYWSKNNSGKVRKVMQEDVEYLENFIAHHIPDIVTGAVIPIVTMIYLFTVDWRMAIAALIPLPLGLLAVYLMMSRGMRKENFRQYHNALEQMHSGAVEFVEGMPVIKVFNITLNSFKKLKNSVVAYQTFVSSISKKQTPYWAVFTGLVLGGGVFILPVGIYLLQSGQIGVSVLTLFLLLGTGCFVEFVKLVIIVSHMELIGEGARRIKMILDEASLIEPQQEVLPKMTDIEFRNVSFRYSDEGPDALKEISTTIPEGSFTAIVGPSGAGKTTLVHLIARLWDTTSGEILIGGVPLGEIGTKGVNKTVGTVFQDVRMLTDTVANNIRMNNNEAPLSRIVEAARTASCHDFILSLPKGYNTVIGDGGEVHLSGGEQQRIALARVVLKNPDIILLDEASSYADAKNEEQMQSAFSRTMIEKTVVVIAHRLSTIINADNILVVDKGRIIEQGTHDQLLADGNLYSRMWQAHIQARHWKLSGQEAIA